MPHRKSHRQSASQAEMKKPSGDEASSVLMPINKDDMEEYPPLNPMEASLIAVSKCSWAEMVEEEMNTSEAGAGVVVKQTTETTVVTSANNSSAKPGKRSGGRKVTRYRKADDLTAMVGDAISFGETASTHSAEENKPRPTHRGRKHVSPSKDKRHDAEHQTVSNATKRGRHDSVQSQASPRKHRKLNTSQAAASGSPEPGTPDGGSALTKGNRLTSTPASGKKPMESSRRGNAGKKTDDGLIQSRLNFEPRPKRQSTNDTGIAQGPGHSGMKPHDSNDRRMSTRHQKKRQDIRDTRDMLAGGKLASTPDAPHPVYEDWSEPNRGWETDMKTLERRQKELDKGYSTTVYKEYVTLVPKRSRVKGIHPRTPNKFMKWPRRSWDTQVRVWRKMLNVWQTPQDFQSDTSSLFDTSMSTNGDDSDLNSTRGEDRMEADIVSPVRRSERRKPMTQAGAGTSAEEDLNSDEDDTDYAPDRSGLRGGRRLNNSFSDDAEDTDISEIEISESEIMQLSPSGLMNSAKRIRRVAGTLVFEEDSQTLDAGKSKTPTKACTPKKLRHPGIDGPPEESTLTGLANRVAGALDFSGMM